eukprot:scaffold4409_cov369-Prasinococcus_capsulatus_cf.AAC.32
MRVGPSPICSWNLKVGDLGMSRLLSRTVLTATTTIASPRWMAPEALRGEETSWSMDVYALGVVVWELVSMQVPWKNSNTWQIMHAVAEVIDHPAVAKEFVSRLEKLKAASRASTCTCFGRRATR